MDIDRIYHLRFRPPIVADWNEIDREADSVCLNEETQFPSSPSPRRALREWWMVGTKWRHVDYALANSAPAILHIEGAHSADMSAVAHHPQLRGLALGWNTKLASLDFLEETPSLEALSIENLRRVNDLVPLAVLSQLRSLQLAGGMDTKLHVQTIEPLSKLTGLRELRLVNIRIGDKSLAPLGALQHLETLFIANNAASLEQFARLSALLPNVECERFQPFVPLTRRALPRHADPVAALDFLGDEKVMVTGKGSPFLHARRDRDKLLRYCAKFRQLTRLG